MGHIINVVILYGNEDEVISYAELLSKQTAAKDIALVVVVNKRGSCYLEEFKCKLDSLDLSIYIFEPNENLGYLNGAIYGYNQYCESTKEDPEWVVISNTDIEFNNNNFYQDFLSTVYSDDIWCVAPSVYSPNKKSYDNPEYINRVSKNRINSLIYIYKRPKLAYYYERLSKLKGKFSRNEKQNSQYIYSAKGCFFIIRKELSKIIFQRKFKALMYSEESYISEIIVENNKKLYYDSNIEVIHNENTVTGKLNFAQKAKYIADSLEKIREEFY